MKINFKTSILPFFMIPALSIGPFANAAEICRNVVDDVKVALQKEAIPDEALNELKALITKDPELQKFLMDENFVLFLEGVAANRPIEEIRPYLNEIWKNPDLNSHGLGGKTGFLLIGPQAANASRLLNAVSKIQINKEAKDKVTPSKTKFNVRRIVDQIKGMGVALKRSKQMIESEMHPSQMDANMFDFYGYIHHQFAFSQLREWKTPQNSMAGIKLSDIEGTDPLTFVKVLMLASQIEAPVNGYSDSSGHIFHLFPQAARFMGKTVEQAAFHKKMRSNQHCTNSWCIEENRHEGLLENLARRLTGFVLPNNRPFGPDNSLSPFNPKDVEFHVVARANNELAASTTYFWLGSHAQGNTKTYLENIRGDELKHSTIFTGLYHYLKGDTYFNRVKGIIKKTLIELKEKTAESPYADVMKTEPVTLIEIIYAQIKYERQIKNYLKNLPLKTLRKFFEADISLPELPAEAMDAEKADRVAKLSKLEEARRKALAGWPKDQRDAAYALEYFESANKAGLLNIVKTRFNSFKGAEDFGSVAHNEFMAQIQKLTIEDGKSYGILTSDKKSLELFKKSMIATLRDYQIMNNRVVRNKGLSVEINDIEKGFELVKDEKYHALEKVAGNVIPKTDTTSKFKSNVIGVEVSQGLAKIKIQKPADFTGKAGDAITLTIQTPQYALSRDLSISNDPAQGFLEVGVRVSDSYFKQAILTLNQGAEIGLSAPKGNLKFDKTKPSVFIAGGIGITPFRGIMQSVANDSTAAPSLLLYANRSAQEIPYKAEIDAMVQKNSRMDVRYFISDTTKMTNEPKMQAGRINKAHLAATAQAMPNDTLFYIVGSPAMVIEMKAALAEIGLPPERIRVEAFRGY
jgi:ferredoxin-NADP reductase